MKQFSQSEKEQYLLSLSEDDFREKVVRRLFKRLGYRDGRDLCGPEEQGKDAVFFEDDKFGVRSLTCVQTKRGSITLAADSQKNLHDIRAQVRTALESSFKCVETKSVLFPTRVYLIASGRINQAAREWITTNNGQDPRIQYLDRDDLIKNVDQHCPETWLSITADVFPYLHALSKLVEDQAVIGPATTLVGGIKSYYAASDVAFVELKLVKSVSSTKKEYGQFKEEFDFEEAGLGALTSLKGERMLLLGDAGSGKSTLLVRAAYLMAREGAAGRNDYRVPVMLRASELRLAGSIVDLMRSSIDQLVGSSIEAFTTDDLESGKVVLLVDGLDELARGEQRRLVVDQLNNFFSLYPRCSIVLTTRPYSSVEAIEGLRGFTRCRISVMSMAGAEKMLLSYQQGKVDHAHTKEILRRIESIHGIELNPLLVTVFALTSEHDRKDIPANITELFSKFTELMLGRWDESKGLSQQYQSKVKDHLISKFAYTLHGDRRTHFSRAEFEHFVGEMLRAMNRESDTKVMVEEVIHRSGLFREVPEGFEFRHHLIQEYFAGKGIPSIDTIKILVIEEWWRNAIVFFFGSHPEDVQGLLDVATSVSSSASEACLTIGLALQTCYLSNLNEKLDVWKWVVDSLAGATARLLEDKDDQKFPIFYFLTHYILSRDAVALSGIENDENNAMDWAVRGNHLTDDPEIRKFWAYVGLSEIGRLDLLLERLKSSPLENDLLNLAISTGCYLAEVVRSLGPSQKDAAKDIRVRLKSKVSVIAHQFAKEYRGQLLEYRRGAIVALDQDEPEPSIGEN